MAEYIEREDAIRILRGRAVAKYPSSFTLGIFASADELKNIPAANVAPVQNGRWRCHGDCGVTECSACGWSIEEYVGDYAYCPNCGAKMNEEVTDNV